jgi:hypothetical protein
LLNKVTEGNPIVSADFSTADLEETPKLRIPLGEGDLVYIMNRKRRMNIA